MVNWGLVCNPQSYQQ